jgi:hypothetical protein
MFDFCIPCYVGPDPNLIPKADLDPEPEFYFDPVPLRPKVAVPAVPVSQHWIRKRIKYDFKKQTFSKTRTGIVRTLKRCLSAEKFAFQFSGLKSPFQHPCFLLEFGFRR